MAQEPPQPHTAQHQGCCGRFSHRDFLFLGTSDLFQFTFPFTSGEVIGPPELPGEAEQLPVVQSAARLGAALCRAAPRARWAHGHHQLLSLHFQGGTRAIVMAVQANIIKYLLFVRNTEHTHLER